MCSSAFSSSSVQMWPGVVIEKGLWHTLHMKQSMVKQTCDSALCAYWSNAVPILHSHDL